MHSLRMEGQPQARTNRHLPQVRGNRSISDGGPGMTSKAARRRANEKETPPAVAANIWEDRPGKARPTPERMAHGAFQLRDTEDAGITVAVDTAATQLDRLAARGTITDEQAQAGHDLAAILYRTRLGSAGRSCLDMTPVGPDTDDAPETWQEKRDREQRTRIWLKCRGPFIWPELVRVCREDQPARKIDALRHGLDVCIAEFKR